MAQGKITPPMQRVLTGIAIGSVVALLLGAAASVAAAIYSPETRSVRVSRRA